MKKKVIFFGSHEIALPAIKYFFSSDKVEITGIVSQPDKPVGRGGKMTPTVISEFAVENKIPLHTPIKPNSETVEWMQTVGCDMIFVMAYGHILKKEILDFPALGIYNLHASILPRYRGASPIETAIANGETTTGVSLMEIVEEMDAGDVVDVENVAIDDNDTYADVARKIAMACPIILERNIADICCGGPKKTTQDSSAATFTKKLSKADGVLDFNRSAFFLKCRINALSPHIGAFLDYDGKQLKIGRATTEPAKVSKNSPGKIVDIGDCLKIATADGMLVIHSLQRPGGKMLPIKDFANGFPLNVGAVVQSHEMTQMVTTQRPQKPAAATH